MAEYCNSWALKTKVMMLYDMCTTHVLFVAFYF